MIMSKAEDLSRQYVLPFLDKRYEKYGEHKQMVLSGFDGYDMMTAYEEGYHQAEKDLEMSWEDIPELFRISEQLKTSWWFRDNEQTKLIGTQTFWEEVLKRFKERKEE